MKIVDFIKSQILIPRIKENGILVVYDPDRRYREICLDIGSDKYIIIDATNSSISSRSAGLKALLDYGKPNPQIEGILFYVPAPAPRTDEEKQSDPFALYGACGSIFPDSDGDEYLSLCLKARPDHATEIRRIFNDNPNPAFAVIDAVGRGVGWPTLQALLGVESARDLLFALLAPSEAQRAALRSQEAWAPEARALFQAALGLPLKTRMAAWSAISEELWRFLLFSEFAFDLPGNLPAALNDVPRAGMEAQPLVFDLCERLRNDLRTQALYIEQAERIEMELNLPATCREIEDFGVRDTFPFEERACFRQAVNALKAEDMDPLRAILGRHNRSVWVGRGENQAQWALIAAAAGLVQACEDASRSLPDHCRSMEMLVDFYTANLRDVDRLQREFEQAAGDAIQMDESMDEAALQARRSYRRLAEQAHAAFLRHLGASGWPLSGRLANADSFDRLVAPRLQESGRRVALFLIDAMRYELGVELSKQLHETGQVEVQPAAAQLPSVTEVGMATLLPGARQGIRLDKHNDRIRVALDEQPLANVNLRMDLLRSRYGQRFMEMRLNDFTVRTRILPTVELLVLRSNEMDNDFETNPEAAPGLISRTFQRILAAVHRLQGLGFQEAFFLTDHGFFLNPLLEPGDACAKPPGSWVNVHERMLLGDGSSDAASMVMPAEQLGIRGDFNQAAFPRSLCAYRSGQPYLHGGISLQEAVVPVISLRFRAQEDRSASQLSLAIHYKRGASKITTRLPVFEITVSGQADLFGAENTIEFLLEAQDSQGNVVGEAKPGGPVNPASRTITLRAGETQQITLKMDLEYEGAFSIKALDPKTSAALAAPLDLETDYMV